MLNPSLRSVVWPPSSVNNHLPRSMAELALLLFPTSHPLISIFQRVCPVSASSNSNVVTGISFVSAIDIFLFLTLGCCSRNWELNNLDLIDTVCTIK